jgi:TIR domain
MSNRSDQLRELREQLVQLPAPTGPDTWSSIRLWAAQARPLIREHYSEHIEDFERAVDDRPWSFGGVVAVRHESVWGGSYVDPEAERAEAECKARNVSANAQYAAEGYESLLACVDGLLRLDYLRGSATKGPASMIKIFISHAAKNDDVATAFVQFLQGSLEISGSTVRCTSVDGYRLSPGQHGSGSLRAEIAGCDVLIGLLTDESLASHYVGMELGAAWVLQKKTVAVLGPDVSFADIPSPLSELHAIRWDRPVDLTLLVDVVSEATSFPKRPGGQPQAALERFVAFVATTAASKAEKAAKTGAAQLTTAKSDADALLRLQSWLGRDDSRDNQLFSFATVDAELRLTAGSTKRLLGQAVEKNGDWHPPQLGDDDFLLKYDRDISVASVPRRRH